MNTTKTIIAKNIATLRTTAGMTQAELAERLNYSDKAVSKWERAESVPEITTLKAIADLFGVTLDDLVTAEHAAPKPEPNRYSPRNHVFISAISILLVWFLAALAYVMFDILHGAARVHWLAFVYAVPVSVVLWLVLNTVWFNRRRNYIIISLLAWAALAAVHISLLPFGYNVWLIYILGIPGQVIILLWSHLKYGKKKK